MGTSTRMPLRWYEQHRGGTQEGLVPVPKKRNMISRVCEHCGTPFETWPCIVKNGYGRFCSRACFDRARTHAETHICEVCGTPFSRAQGHMNRVGRGRYCSHSCSDHARASKVHPLQAPHNSTWQQDRYVNTQGYVVITVDGERVQEHRYVAERMLGRPLRPDEVVHHRDRNRTNNDECNLQVMTRSEHMTLHAREDESRRLTQWSKAHTACVQCGTTAVKHQGDGLCRNCYMVRWKRAKAAIRPASA
jgi:hypothetical protein